MEKIRIFFRQLRCKHHDADLLRWHWTHGMSGNEPAFIEAEYCCKECGKIIYLYQRGKEAHDWAKAMAEHKKA